MKKWTKKGLAFIASLSLGTATIAPTVNAQEYNAQFFTELMEKNQNLKSAKIEGTAKLSISSDGQTADVGNLNISMAYNLEPLGASFEGVVNSLLLGGQEISFKAYVQDGLAYFGYPTSDENGETKIEWSASTYDVEAVKAYFAEGMSNDEVNRYVDYAKLGELLVKYWDVTETDSEYVVSLKESVDADAFISDVKAAVDLEAIKAEALAQYEAEAEKPLTDEEKAAFNEYIGTNYENVIRALISSNPKLSNTYDKETGYLKALDLDVTLNAKDFVGTQVEETGFNIESARIVMNLVITGHGETQTWEVPTEALDAQIETSDNI